MQRLRAALEYIQTLQQPEITNQASSYVTVLLLFVINLKNRNKINSNCGIYEIWFVIITSRILKNPHIVGCYGNTQTWHNRVSVILTLDIDIS